MGNHSVQGHNWGKDIHRNNGHSRELLKFRFSNAVRVHSKAQPKRTKKPKALRGRP
jgi:hypothetical protein